MSVLQVGQPYIPGRTSIEPRAEYNFRGGQHELLLCFLGLTNAEVSAVQEGEVEFALVLYGAVIFLLYRFHGGIDWADVPYSWHGVSENQRQLPELPATTETRALLQVILVDAASNIVRALRVVRFSSEFTRSLQTAIADQASRPWNRENYEAELRQAHQWWATTEHMLSYASARMRGRA